jgi:hemoglobin
MSEPPQRISEEPAFQRTAYDRIGGEAGLRAIIDDFIDRVFDDIMIGFFFRNAAKSRVKEFEFQHACEFLGGPVVYAGRPLRELHARFPIMGGHFSRRLQLLRQVFAAHGVPEDIAAAWVDHNASLRAVVMR